MGVVGRSARAALVAAAAIVALGLETSAQECTFSVEATAMTKSFVDDSQPSAPDADDAAVLFNAESPEDSLVVGTLKEGGLAVFNLSAALVQSIAAPAAPSVGDAPGRFNNVAVVRGNNRDLVVVSDRGLDQLRFFALGEDGLLADVSAAERPFVFSEDQAEVNVERTAYGLTAVNFKDQALAFVSQRERSAVAKLIISDNGEAGVTYSVGSVLTEFLVNSTWTPCTEEDGEEPQLEGLVVDPADGTVMLSQETVGLWKTTVESFGTEPLTLVDRVDYFGASYTREVDPEDPEEYICQYGGTLEGGNIKADAEGIALYTTGDSGFYVLSSQGANRFEVYDRAAPHAHLASFTIALGDDGVSSTDGVEIYSGVLPGYPSGLMVVQDEGDSDDTSFKFVSMENVLSGLASCDPEEPTGDDDDDEDGLDIGASVAIIAIVFVLGGAFFMYGVPKLFGEDHSADESAGDEETAGPVTVKANDDE